MPRLTSSKSIGIAIGAVGCPLTLPNVRLTKTFAGRLRSASVGLGLCSSFLYLKISSYAAAASTDWLLRRLKAPLLLEYLPPR